MFRFPEPLLVQKPEDEVMTARLEPRRQETEVVRYVGLGPVYGALGYSRIPSSCTAFHLLPPQLRAAE